MSKFHLFDDQSDDDDYIPTVGQCICEFVACATMFMAMFVLLLVAISMLE